MTAPSWKASGQYYETCSCDYFCPCILQQMAVEPSKGTCTFAMAFQIEKGTFGPTSLDGLGFIVLGFTPEAMGKGNWSVGLVIDDAKQCDTAVFHDDMNRIVAGGLHSGEHAAGERAQSGAAQRMPVSPEHAAARGVL